MSEPQRYPRSNAVRVPKPPADHFPDAKKMVTPGPWPEQRQRLEELVGLRRFAQPGDLTADISAALARIDRQAAEIDALRADLSMLPVNRDMVSQSQADYAAGRGQTVSELETAERTAALAARIDRLEAALQQIARGDYCQPSDARTPKMIALAALEDTHAR